MQQEDLQFCMVSIQPHLLKPRLLQTPFANLAAALSVQARPADASQDLIFQEFLRRVRNLSGLYFEGGSVIPRCDVAGDSSRLAHVGQALAFCCTRTKIECPEVGLDKDYEGCRSCLNRQGCSMRSFGCGWNDPA